MQRIDTSPQRSRLARRLRTVLRGDVLFDAASRGRYASDASIYQIEPVGVVVPADEADVFAAIDLAREMRVPVLPRGAGTSLCGQSVGEALVIDHSRHLNAITAFDPQAMTIEVQPGIVLDRLNAFLEPHGLWFPVDISSSAQATLGGMAATNAGGARSIVHGNMVHNVLGIDAILSDGTAEHFGPFGAAAARPLASGRSGDLVARLFELAARERDEIGRAWPKLAHRAGGYNLDVFHPLSARPYTADGSVNLAHLLVGSEGTLAWFRRLVLRLAPLPKARALAVMGYPALRAALRSVPHIVKLGPSAVELADRAMLERARAEPALRPAVDRVLAGPAGRAPEAVLLVEFYGDEPAAASERLARLAETIGDLGQPCSVAEVSGEAAQRTLWAARRAGLDALLRPRGDARPLPFIEDCAVPLEHLAGYAEGLAEVLERHGVRAAWHGHAAAGMLHVRPILDLRRSGPDGGVTKMRAIADEVAQLVRRCQGVFSGEHGDGLARGERVRWQFGPRLTHAFEQVKDLFDPAGLMNPGKIVRVPRMDDASLLRFAPGHAIAPLDTALDWSAWDVGVDASSGRVGAPGSGGDPARGYAKAVEMCDGNGRCRKLDAGTMCPSYRATRDERDSTRGRANTLRLALSGRLGDDALGSQALFDTLALCVGCKGCRRECPAGVDMTRMKTEFLYHYRRRHALPWRERLVAYLPRYAPWAARLHGLANLRDRIPGLARLSERMLGLAAARRLPVWRRDVFTRTEAARAARGPDAGRSDGGSGDGREVVLWADTFDDYFEPDNLRAARRVLEAGGYRVHVARPAAGDAQPGRPLCCGRTFLSTGLVDEARAEARRTLAALAPWVQRGVAVVGIEPACLLTMRDEFLALGLGEAAVALSSQALLFEEFLAREHAAGRLGLRLRPLPQRRALLHGHCHQKAFDAMRPIEVVLGLVPSLAVETIASGCCGMAGAFGYEAEHYAVSMKMGELALLPAVRAAGPDDLIVADGASCRRQVADGAQREALHVARVLELALAPADTEGPSASAGAD